MPVEVSVEDLVRIGIVAVEETQGSLKKLARRLEKEGFIKSFRAATGLFLLAQRSGRECVFLGPDRLCTVYEKRPDVCRGFPTALGPRVGNCPYKKKLEAVSKIDLLQLAEKSDSFVVGPKRCST